MVRKLVFIKQGEFRISAENEIVSSNVFFSDLEHPSLKSEMYLTQDKGRFHGVTINVKYLLKFLSAHVVDPSHVVCCFTNLSMLVFYVYLTSVESDNEQSTTLTYYVPINPIE
jgi:hypothetical protein